MRERDGLWCIPLVDRSDQIVGWSTVDFEDFDELSQWRWTKHRHGYAQRRISRSGLVVLMHRQILGLERGDRREADHINRNKLDNRRSNLRIVTHAQNGQNLPQVGRGRSRFRGVFWQPGNRIRHWRAVVWVDGRPKSLGYFLTEAEAGAAASAFRRAHLPYSVEAAV